MDEENGWNQTGELQYKGELSGNRENYLFTQYKFQYQPYSIQALQAGNYLQSIETHVPQELISLQNFEEIKRLGQYFTKDITSFFGFETRLGSLNNRSDFLFAVSSRGGERESLLNLLQKNGLPDVFLQKKEWQRVKEFVTTWANPSSLAYEKILGLWLEFDTATSTEETPIPCMFLQLVPLDADDEHRMTYLSWIIHSAIPLMTGAEVSQKLQQQLINIVQHLPEGSSLIHLGVMLSRATEGVRLLFNKLSPKHILSFLESLGWSDTDHKLIHVLEELNQPTSRLVLHIHITEQGVHPKIGIECSFSPDKYHQETQWEPFFDYLIQKGVCCPQKKNTLLQFLGVEQESSDNEFDFNSFIPSVKLYGKDSSKALVRYISHIKVLYTPNKPLEAKAYPGVRVFGHIETTMNGQYQ